MNASPASPTILPFLRLTAITVTISITTMSTNSDENMANQEEEEPPETLESYAALVKQLVRVVNMILYDSY
jgi:hypothetical protein